MKTEFRKSFAKDLKKIKDKSLLTKLKSAIEAVEAADTLSSISNLKKLKAEGDYYRIRVGDYRIGLMLNAGSFIFIRCLHRREIYRYFPD
ncbi:MAG: type II toxin-antitoxin system RelE/ParE family toxin [Cyanobacteria bacterium P01_C01_bin.118]